MIEKKPVTVWIYFYMILFVIFILGLWYFCKNYLCSLIKYIVLIVTLLVVIYNVYEGTATMKSLKSIL